MTRPSLLFHGPFQGLSSFALVNRRLAAGLDALGWRVSALSSAPIAGHTARPPARPDVYLFHGHPYDITSAPGRFNAFFLSYDYRRFLPTDRPLARRLNAWFDVVVVPSRFSRDACIASGVSIPVVVCPYGADFDEFRPDATPVRIPGRRSHCFLVLGGGTPRKGVDIAIDAFTREFSAADDVTLLVKVFAYADWRGWLDSRLARVNHARNRPHVILASRETRSVAGYFAAADIGVFPFRGEGFGLPILECLASGRPAIVTRAGGPLDYGTTGVSWLPAAPRHRRGTERRDDVEPSRSDLQALMRASAEAGRTATSPARIRASVSRFTWSAASRELSDILANGRHRSRHTGPKVATAFFFIARGLTSWKRTAIEIGRAVRALPRARTVAFDAGHRPPQGDTVICQSGVALEPFLRADAARCILHRESAPLAVMARIVARERRACAAPADTPPPMALWRDAREATLADTIVVPSQVSASHFARAGYAASKVRIVRPGIVPARRLPPRRGATTRFLFVASDPFRKGVRPLLEAWAAARPPAAELWCVMSQSALTSPIVLRHLTRDSRISVRSFSGVRAFLPLYDEIDVIILPSLEDGFGTVVADGMARGRPAVVSDETGISELMMDGENGRIARAGSTESLTEAIVEMSSNPLTRRRIADAAYETTRSFTCARFRDEITTVITEGRRPR